MGISRIRLQDGGWNHQPRINPKPGCVTGDRDDPNARFLTSPNLWLVWQLPRRLDQVETFRWDVSCENSRSFVTKKDPPVGSYRRFRNEMVLEFVHCS
jgi:hypothetical protein